MKESSVFNGISNNDCMSVHISNVCYVQLKGFRYDCVLFEMTSFKRFLFIGVSIKKCGLKILCFIHIDSVALVEKTLISFPTDL